MRFRSILPVLAFFGVGFALCTAPALASSSGGDAGVFQPVVDFMLQFKTAIVVSLIPLCVIFWIGMIGSIASNGGNLNGLGWTMLIGAFCTTALLVVDAIVQKFGSGALIAAAAVSAAPPSHDPASVGTAIAVLVGSLLSLVALAVAFVRVVTQRKAQRQRAITLAKLNNLTQAHTPNIVHDRKFELYAETAGYRRRGEAPGAYAPLALDRHAPATPEPR